jgi:spore coat protein CotH
MTVTFTASYRDTLAPETVALIDKFQEEMFDLGCMLEFIDEHSEEDFREYYEDYVEVGEENGYEAVDAFINENDISDLKYFVDAYIGEYQSPERMAEDYFDGETDRLDYRISIDWEETAEYLLQHDVDRVGDFYFRCIW